MFMVGYVKKFTLHLHTAKIDFSLILTVEVHVLSSNFDRFWGIWDWKDNSAFGLLFRDHFQLSVS